MIARLLVPLHALQLAALLWLAHRALFCCDARYYIDVGRELLAQGLVYEPDQFAGYRSYFVPLVFGLLEKIPAPAMAGSGEKLPFTLSIAFTLVSFAVSRYIVRKEGLARYLVFAAPVFFNPFLLAQVPYPLQESALLLIVAPIVVVLLAVRSRSALATFALAVAAGALALAIRGSIGWLALPLAVFVLLEARRAPAEWRAASKARLAAVALAVPLVLIAPQSYVMQEKFGTLHPYPRVDTLAQVFYGIEMFKMATVLRDGNWTQVRFLSPAAKLPIHEKITFGFYGKYPGTGLMIVVAHVWAGLHYDALVPYVKFERLRVLNPWIVLSSLVVAFGLMGLAFAFRAPGDRSRAAFLAATLAFSCLYTAFVGVEARFGIFGFLALSIAAAWLASAAEGRALMRRAAPLVAAYVLLCIAFGGLVLYASPDIA
jgi:hypothetical protein